MSSSTTCIICYSPLTNPAVLYPCKHTSFCYICILTWLNTRAFDQPSKFQRFCSLARCPLCRSEPLIIRVTHPRGSPKRTFAVQEDLAYARLFSAGRAELLRQCTVTTTTNIALRVFVYVELRRLQKVLESRPVGDEVEQMLLATSQFHATACDALEWQDRELLPRILKLLRKMDRITKEWGDFKLVPPPIRWRLKVVRKLVGR
jgi:hypothetical protein